jgi:hypothetical protein
MERWSVRNLAYGALDRMKSSSTRETPHGGTRREETFARRQLACEVQMFSSHEKVRTEELVGESSYEGSLPAKFLCFLFIVLRLPLIEYHGGGRETGPWETSTVLALQF